MSIKKREIPNSISEYYLMLSGSPLWGPFQYAETALGMLDPGESEVYVVKAEYTLQKVTMLSEGGEL